MCLWVKKLRLLRRELASENPTSTSAIVKWSLSTWVQMKARVSQNTHKLVNSTKLSQ